MDQLDVPNEYTGEVVSDQLKREAGVEPPMHVTSDDDYEKVPHGAEFIDPEGKKRYKPIRNDADFEALRRAQRSSTPPASSA